MGEEALIVKTTNLPLSSTRYAANVQRHTRRQAQHPVGIVPAVGPGGLGGVQRTQHDPSRQGFRQLVQTRRVDGDSTMPLLDQTDHFRAGELIQHIRISGMNPGARASASSTRGFTNAS